jgi:hypothetical protein
MADLWRLLLDDRFTGRPHGSTSDALKRTVFVPIYHG